MRAGRFFSLCHHVQPICTVVIEPTRRTRLKISKPSTRTRSLGRTTLVHAVVLRGPVWPGVGARGENGGGGGWVTVVPSVNPFELLNSFIGPRPHVDKPCRVRRRVTAGDDLCMRVRVYYAYHRPNAIRVTRQSDFRFEMRTTTRVRRSNLPGERPFKRVLGARAFVKPTGGGGLRSGPTRPSRQVPTERQ